MITADWTTASRLLLQDKIGVIPTDTIYGFSARVENLEGIERIYQAKSRDPKKSLVILASSLEQILEFFPITTTPQYQEALQESEKSPLSIVYPLDREKRNAWSHPYYHGDSLAIRIPYQKPELIKLLEKTGPIVSTSVNREGEPSKTHPDDIEQSFGIDIDFILEEGVLAGRSSQIIRITQNGNREILR